jgi:hypothetical protein
MKSINGDKRCPSVWPADVAKGPTTVPSLRGLDIGKRFIYENDDQN